MTDRLLTTAMLAALATLALLASAAPAAETEGLPPPAPGREVLIDSRAMTTTPGLRSLTLSDLDPETAEIVREINSKPGTWQLYLLYTAEDLPERMFHPGFAIRLGRRRPVSMDLPEVQADQPRAPEAGDEPPAPAPTERRPLPR